MKILLTGATGFVGRYLVEALLHSGHAITCLVRDTRRAQNVLGNQVDLVECDLTKRMTEDHSTLLSADVAFHLAACVSSPRIQDFVNTNVKGTKNLVELLTKSGQLKKIIYLSSISVVGRNSIGSISEEVSCHPFSIYGKTKLAAEKQISDLKRIHPDIEVYIVRAPIIYGNGQSELVTDFFRKIKRRNLTIVGNGNNKRSMCYIKNLVQSLMLMLDKKLESLKPEIFNIADEETYRLKEIIAIGAQMMNVGDFQPKTMPSYCAKLGLGAYQLLTTIGYNSVALFALSTSVSNIDCSIEKAKRVLNYHPNYTFMDGLRKTLNLMLQSTNV